MFESRRKHVVHAEKQLPIGRPNEHGIPGIVHKNKPSISNMQHVLISWAYLEYSPSLATCRRTSRRIQFLHTSTERPTLIMIWLYFDFCMSYYPFWYFRLEQLNEHIWALIMSFPKFQPFNRYNAWPFYMTIIKSETSSVHLLDFWLIIYFKIKFPVKNEQSHQ